MPNRWVVRAVVAALVCSIVGALTSGCDNSGAAAQKAARTYLNTVASGSKADIARLFRMTATDDPGALRMAGDLLASATTRITIVDVTDPSSVAASNEIGAGLVDSTFVDFTRFGVRYRLKDKTYQGAVVLAHPQEQSGRDPANWRVVSPLTGSITWPEVGFLDGVAADIYLDGTRIVRTPRNESDDESHTVQPLYPAIYQVQQRLDPYYASAVSPVAVPARPVEPPKLTLGLTSVAKKLLIKEIWAGFASCETEVLDCPVSKLVLNVDFSAKTGWWLGLIKRPKLIIANDGVITLSGGAFRYRDDRGTHTIRFSSTAKYALDNQSWKPMVYDYDAQETW